jgi:hypothetical protein
MYEVDKLGHLLESCRAIGIVVRDESLGGGGGGLCRLRGQRVLFVDADADDAGRYEKTISALKDEPEFEQMFLPPVIREDFQRSRDDDRSARGQH